MNAIILSSNPYALFQNQSELEHQVLNYLLSLSVNGVYVWPSQTTIAEATGYSPRSVATALSKLKAMGLVEVIRRRFKNSNIHKLSDFFYREDVQRVLPLFFRRFPKAIFTLKLLINSSANNLFRKTIRYLESYLNNRIGTVEQSKKELIFNICRAFHERGATPNNYDALYLCAFSEKLLREVCKILSRSHPKRPIAFFVSECKRIAAEWNEKPDFKVTEDLKSRGVTFFLPDFWLTYKPAPRPESQKGNGSGYSGSAGVRQGSKAIPYAEQVKLIQEKEKRLETESYRRGKTIDVAKEITEALSSLEALSETNEFAKILTTGWKKQEQAAVTTPLVASVVTNYGFESIQVPILESPEKLAELISSIPEEKKQSIEAPQIYQQAAMEEDYAEDIHDYGGFDPTLEDSFTQFPYI